MKKNFSTIILILLASTAFAQWSLNGNSNATTSSKLGTTTNIPVRMFTNNAERLHINANVSGKVGYVGIGTTAPNTRLHVNGVVTATGGTSNTWNFASRVAGSFSGNRIPRWNGSAFVNSTITDNGTNVGIGFNAPAFPLEVAGRMRLRSLAGNTAGTWLNNVTNTNSVAFMGMADDNHVGFWGNLGVGWGFAMDCTNGRIGIGTLAPFRKLHLQDGDIRIETSTGISRYIEFLKTGASPDWRIEHGSSGYYMYLSASTNDFASVTDKFQLDGNPASSIVFHVFGSSLGNSWQTFSDAKLKNNIQDFSNAMDIISKLKPKTYFYKSGSFNNLNLPKEKQYGLIAQDVETVLPELVSNTQVPVRINGNGEREMEEIKAINYTELIPVLIKAVQELKAENDQMKKDMQQCCFKHASLNSTDRLYINGHDQPMLQQNAPNPFDKETNISYYLPDNTTAQLRIMSLDGHEVLTESITHAGYGTITISGQTMAAGTYTYTLIVDGKAVESKIMVLTKG